MIDFLINYSWLISVSLSVISILILLLKRNRVKIIDTVFEQLLIRLPVMIRSVEAKGLSGSEKKLTVMTYAISWLSDFTGLSSSLVQDTYGKRIDEFIEAILSTPEKKEVLYEKDNEKKS